jgi:hypothetical protein
MTVAVVTTFSPKGYEVYGRRMISTFDRNWPKDVPLYVYYEGEKPADASERATWLPLAADEDRTQFAAKHKDHPVDYRRQPIKFSHKVFAITGAPRDTDWLIWLDGDIEATAPISHDFLSWALPDDGSVAAYMGRDWWLHTESGFVAYRMNEYGRAFLDDMRRAYMSGLVTTLPEWHDCMVFDHLRRVYEKAGYKFHDLAADYHGPGLDVMPATVLGDVMRHHKGPKQKRHAYGDVA